MSDLTDDEKREAVDLADGWSLSGATTSSTDWIETPSGQRLYIRAHSPEIFDALAMLLARQAREKWPHTWWEDDSGQWPTGVRNAWLAATTVGNLLGEGDSAGAIRVILEARVLKHD